MPSLIKRQEIPEQDTVNLKKQLKTYLELRGLTVAELARLSRVSRQVIESWLGGAQPKKVVQIRAVAQALRTSIDHLCFGEGVDREKEKQIEILHLMDGEWLSGCFDLKIRLRKEK